MSHFAAESSAVARLEARAIQLFTVAVARGTVTLPDLPAEIASAPLKMRAFSRLPGLCGLVGAVCCALPVFFATPVPPSGFAGIYARWLVFWDGALYVLLDIRDALEKRNP